MKSVKAFAGRRALRNLYSGKQGRIHSLFKNSFNVQFDDSLIGFVKNKKYAGLFNISIDYDGNFLKLLEGLKEFPVYLYNDILHFGNVPVFKFYEVKEFYPFRYLKNKLGENGTKWSKEYIQEKIKRFEGQIKVSLKKLEDDISIKLLMDKIEKSNFTNLTELMGLGPGLTPAGDDYISGYLLAESYINFCAHREIFLSQLKKMLFFINSNKRKTNDISYHMLKTAAMLGGPKVAIDFLVSLFKSEESHLIEKNFKNLLGIGATSGVFFALGIVKSTKKYMEVKPVYTGGK